MSITASLSQSTRIKHDNVFGGRVFRHFSWIFNAFLLPRDEMYPVNFRQLRCFHTCPLFLQSQWKCRCLCENISTTGTHWRPTISLKLWPTCLSKWVHAYLHCTSPYLDFVRDFMRSADCVWDRLIGNAHVPSEVLWFLSILCVLVYVNTYKYT